MGAEDSSPNAAMSSPSFCLRAREGVWFREREKKRGLDEAIFCYPDNYIGGELTD